jgi:co-chaperonin GroES (HSP10)
MCKQQAIRPLGRNLLIRKLKGEEKVGNIILPQDTRTFERGSVLEVSPELFQSTPYNQQPVHVGDVVLYPRDAEQVVAIGDDVYFVPLAAIAAVETPCGICEDDSRSGAFFKVRDWAEFVPQGAEQVWRRWENVKEFSFDVGFMEPFATLEPLRESIYECCNRIVGPKIEDLLEPFQFREATARDEADGDERLTLLECGHDRFDGAIYLSKKKHLLGFRKQKTTLRCLVETVPTWMRAVHAIMSSAPFVSLVRPDYSRVLFARFGLKQIIQLESEAFEPVQNSQLMGHFLRFGLNDDSPVSPTIEKLGCEEIGRSDVKFSFHRRIGATPYLIWFTAQAPLNEAASTIHIEWDIQDVRPRHVMDREYGEILDNFLRVTLFGEFYRAWFKNVNCHSLL